MQEFEIRLGSVKDVQEFVDMAATRPFDITVRDEHNKISADSFMELFCLDFAHPLRVICDCGEEDFQSLVRDFDRFLVKE